MRAATGQRGTRTGGARLHRAPPRGGRGLLPLAAMLCAVLAGCERPAVAWEEPQRHTAAAGAADSLSGPALSGGAEVADVAVLAAGDGGRRAPPPANDATAPPDAAGRRCEASLRLAWSADATGRPQTYAAWWAVRPDSSALLVAARSDDGGATWARTLAVDTLDRSGRGCARPAPALAADSVNGFVHVVYFMEAPEGPGVFYAHLMDPRAEFEPAAVVMYGERPSAASVASRGDTVVVAYENPNGDRPRVELALSYTGGHRFDRRGILASSPNSAAEAPSVALDGRRLAVAWVERHAAPSSPPTVVVRRGELQ